MENNTYSEENFSIRTQGDSILIQGKIETFDYDKLLKFLTMKVKELATKNLNIDFRNSNYISSKGIKLFARFIHDYPHPIKLIVDTSLEWQTMGLEPLSKIKAEGMIDIIRD